MADKTWRDIPVKDIVPMLNDPESLEEFNSLLKKMQHYWPDDSDNKGKPVELVVMTYVLTAGMVISTPKENRAEEFVQFTRDYEEILNTLFESVSNRYADQQTPVGIFGYLLKFAGPLSEGLTLMDPERTKKCYSQILDFIKLNEQDLQNWTLGKLFEKLIEWTEKNKDEKDFTPGKTKLEQTLNNSKLYQIWCDRREHLLTPSELRIASRLKNGVRQIILTGAPGTGKSRISERLASHLGEKLPREDKDEGKPYVRVQFHPSYDYTDFVEGLRPVNGENGNITYVKLDGHFKKFCRQVVKYGKPGEHYFFLIDEINRADLSKVFGELMFCLEADKRGEDHKVDTQYQNLLTYDLEKKRELETNEDKFAKGFYIPESVYIIGTMNDIDRSVESMDFALRRRFEFIEIKVDEDSLKDAFEDMGFTDDSPAKLAKSVASLNDTIKDEGKPYGLNRNYFISQGQFANLPDNIDKGKADKVKEYVWEYRVEPLLREYMRGEEDADTFVKKCEDKFLNKPENTGESAQSKEAEAGTQ